MDVERVIGQVQKWIMLMAGLGLAVLLVAIVLGQFGVQIPVVNRLGPTELVYTCGAYWLLKGGKLS